jgi:ATP-dependent Lon protease
MSDKIDNSVFKKGSKTIDNATLQLVDKKVDFFKDVIQKTILHVQKQKTLDILGVSDVSICIDKLIDLNKKINDKFKDHSNANTDIVINNLQSVNNDFSSLIKNYGTDNLEDLLIICFGNTVKITTNETETLKFDILKKYFHPTGYKILTTKDEKGKKTSGVDDEINAHLECSDIVSTFKQFYMKVYGIKVVINNINMNKKILIYGIVDDVLVSILNNKFIATKTKQLNDFMPIDFQFDTETFKKFTTSLTLKDYLIHNTPNDILKKFVGYDNYINTLKHKPISQIIKDFILDELYVKRLTLINLLIKNEDYENQYLAYLLYDILSSETTASVDTDEQTILFDSFPWQIKQYFKTAMKKTIQYTNELSNFEINKIPIEQQICLLKADDSVKEKAMMKLKEVKAKSEDSGSKARQYLDGLLKIPFNIYRREPILNIMGTIKSKFKEMYKTHNFESLLMTSPKEKYTSVEILKNIKQVSTKLNITSELEDKNQHLKQIITICDKNTLIENVLKINNILVINKLENVKIIYYGRKKTDIKGDIEKLLDKCFNEHKEVLQVIKCAFNAHTITTPKSNNIEKDIKYINNTFTKITDYMDNVNNTLNKAVYGHNKAKSQIKRIIGQWINGEQDGYCFGFEGPPGVGKTSLAKKGLSDCLKDETGVSRPFAMIQMGGDSNGSTIHGHNYTYVGSTWGSIVQILIDKKCMNPIIFIDEVDKISKTEHGKEIVGILTHLLDPAQNDCFQDKYFTGINLDLSKALFILSYNDVEAIDKILLDRVHRIKFSNLSLEDKLIISKKHILPEVYKKMGLEDVIYFSDDVIKFIIDEYTGESGVRKLKEILFEIVGEINLDILQNNDSEYEFPINITIENIKHKYFKDKHEVRNKKIHNESKIGVINGLWANSVGKGGVISIQSKWRPSDKFLTLHLTGLQGDVMKESMNVALTLAWNLTSIERRDQIWDEQTCSINGIHIHCPEGSVPKDGPSAGTAITSTLYSLFNNKKIKHNIAITGEISLDGFVTEIGGLDLKILGGIKAGVKEFLFPVENMKDYTTFIDKYKDSDLINGIKFYPINTIQEVFELIFED